MSIRNTVPFHEELKCVEDIELNDMAIGGGPSQVNSTVVAFLLFGVLAHLYGSSCF